MKILHSIIIFAWSSAFTAHAGLCGSKDIIPVTSPREFRRPASRVITASLMYAQKDKSSGRSNPDFIENKNALQNSTFVSTISAQPKQSEQALTPPAMDTAPLLLETQLDTQQEQHHVQGTATSSAPLDQKPRILAPLIIPTRRFESYIPWPYESQDERQAWCERLRDIEKKRKQERAEREKTQQAIPPHIAILSLRANYQTLAIPQAEASASDSTQKMSVWDRRHQPKKQS